MRITRWKIWVPIGLTIAFAVVDGVLLLYYVF